MQRVKYSALIKVEDKKDPAEYYWWGHVYPNNPRGQVYSIVEKLIRAHRGSDEDVKIVTLTTGDLKVGNHVINLKAAASGQQTLFNRGGK